MASLPERNEFKKLGKSVKDSFIKSEEIEKKCRWWG